MITDDNEFKRSKSKKPKPRPPDPDMDTITTMQKKTKEGVHPMTGEMVTTGKRAAKKVALVNTFGKRKTETKTTTKRTVTKKKTETKVSKKRSSSQEKFKKSSK